MQKLPEAVRACSKLIQLDVAANDDLDAIPTGAYLANMRDLDLSRCDFHRCQTLHHQLSSMACICSFVCLLTSCLQVV